VARERLNVLIVISHPVQYFAPLFRLYAAEPSLALTVAYCSLHGAESGRDPEFGTDVAWDVPLLDGYRWVQPQNLSPRPGLNSFVGQINPALWQLILRGDFDVVVCYGYRTISAWIAGLAAKRAGSALALVTDALQLEPLDRRSWKIPLKRLVLPRIYKFADGAFALSSGSRSFLERLGMPPNRVFLVPYVVDNDFFARGAAGADRAAVRERLGVRPDDFLALFAGKLVSWKRVADLVQAAAAAPVQLVCAGSGPEQRQLEQLAAKLGIRDRVRFLGFVNQSELPELYAAADVLCLPSEYEAFGLVVNEAFSCGVPAIVSAACGAAEDLVREGETGFVVPVGDVSAYADRLARLAGDRDLLRHLGDRARARIADWGPSQSQRAFADACLALVGGERARD
jgi:glycosyltransferase involved in cell wall biosynthesis